MNEEQEGIAVKFRIQNTIQRKEQGEARPTRRIDSEDESKTEE